jgi:hypothetical protein
VDQGEIVCAYKPINWFQVEKGTEIGRSFFEGEDVDGKHLLKIQESSELLTKKFGRGQALAYASLSDIG